MRALVFSVFLLPAISWADCHTIPAPEDVAFYDAASVASVRGSAWTGAIANQIANGIIAQRRLAFPNVDRGERRLYDALVLSAIEGSASATVSLSASPIISRAASDAWMAMTERMARSC